MSPVATEERGQFVISFAVANPEDLTGEVLSLYMRAVGKEVEKHRLKIREDGSLRIEIHLYTPTLQGD